MPAIISRYIHLGAISIASEQTLLPAFNIAPTNRVSVVAQVDAAVVVTEMVWGLTPRWATAGSGIGPLINARSETLSQKPTYRNLLKTNRCLVPATGFFEWQKQGKVKQPFYFSSEDEEIVSFAGLWDTWQGDGISIQTCTIITTAPNELVQPMHDRMPAIIPRDAEGAWLDHSNTPADVLPLLQPYPSELMRATPVSQVVNKAGYDSPECIEPVLPEQFLF